ncbi:PREDICTED: DNA ligase 1 [Nelumbo nucifera]|uniref:DNA ligase 1 n=2 Tax=Nelumbo nucifera TaxID=4432 RepID=A0A1U8AQU3_NELNU|nr:PREDICTED: DNA ligase 1 [Nelumbo nucifera]XP_010270235.1 PREDICTED: DNA ligase 1 [Nelumbo nucifera]DAD20225.1 TPA_asm: hypothetical protein HUJ06_021688 [Nelumbo nucifera]
MAEAETVTDVADAPANGFCPPEDTGENATLKKEEDNNGVKEMEGHSKEDEKTEAVKMDEDCKLKEEEGKMEESETVKTEEQTGSRTEEESEVKGEEKSEESREEKTKSKETKWGKGSKRRGRGWKVGKKQETDKMNVDNDLKEEREIEEPETPQVEEENDSKEGESGEKVEEKDKESKEVKTKEEEKKEGNGSKKRGRERNIGEKQEASKKDVTEENTKDPTTPVLSSFDRPVRERKSVERLVISIEKEAAKEFHIEKGRGTPLKDIPNVAYKLSRRKTDETFKLLHLILFGRRAKASHVKSNISQFSGFIWHENEEKQKLKIKEKLDKCVKEKLLEFCDVLDIHVAKATTRKEDIVTKLIDFLAAPQATTDVLLAEKELSGKTRKRKRVLKRSASKSGDTSTRSSRKKQRSEDTQKQKGKKSAAEIEDESEEENGVPGGSEDEASDHSEREEREDESADESAEETKKRRRGSKKPTPKKESAGKTKTKKIATPKKASPIQSPKRTPSKSSSRHSKADSTSITNPKVSRKKKIEETTKKKSSTPVKSATKKKGTSEKSGKKAIEEEEMKPSEDELRDAICEILKEVDFNTATFTDILKQLARRFDTDLTSRKSAIKVMIQEELTKLADEAEENEDDEDGEGDADKDDPKPTSHVVET